MSVVLAGIALGVWLLAPENRMPVSSERVEVGSKEAMQPASVASSPELASPIPAVTNRSSPTPETGDTQPAEPPTPAQVAFEAHARRAEVWWTDAMSILQHAEPQGFADAAEGFAARMRSVGPRTPAPVLQEVIHEERQLLNVLRRRYSGVPPLMDLVQQLEHDVQAVQDQVTEVGPSPDPRKGLTEPG